MSSGGSRRGRQRSLRRWLTVAAVTVCCLGAPFAFADSPARIIDSFPGTGGDSVTGGGDWSIITDELTCDVQIDRLNYATMAWDDFQTVSSILGSTCSNGEFGVSSSLAGNVLVVGVPGWDENLFGTNANNYGAIAVFSFDGTSWDRQGGLNSGIAIGLLQVPPDLQIGERFGSSVSVSQSPTNPNEYLIVVGAPGRDVSGSDDGRVYAYRYNPTVGGMTLIYTFNGGAAGDQLGFSVTTDYPYFLAGAPGNDGLGTDSGVAYLFEASETGGVLTGAALSELLSAGTAGSRLGIEVSLGAEFAQVAADDPALGVAYVFENTGTAAARNYQLVGFPAVPTFGGDVSQSAGVAGYGYNEAGSEGARILRDPLVDRGVAARIDLDAQADVGGDTSDVGIDVRLVRESLWLANAAADRALLYRFPAGFGAWVDSYDPSLNNYAQINIPCDVDGLTVDDLFGYLGTAAVPGVTLGDYIVYGYDDTDVTDPNPYQVLPGSHTFSGFQDTSLWIAVLTGQYVSVAACNGFTSPSLVGGNVVGGVPDRVAAQRIVVLPNPDPVAGFGRVLVNNPFPREARLSDMRFSRGGVLKTLAQAEADNDLSATFYVYDVNSTIPSGQKYRAITAAGTPPFGDRIEGHEGFWVRVLENGAGGLLYMPQSK